MMMQIIGIIAAALAIGGVLLNNHRLIACFPVWIVSNFLTGFLHLSAGLYALFVRDIVFTLLAVHGWRVWRRKG